MGLKPTAVINIVGLTQDLLAGIPSLNGLVPKESVRRIRPVFPALTCSAQATYLTGVSPSDHGVVGNGWYFQDQAQVSLWKQSHHLLGGKKVWEVAKEKDPQFTCANMFWWFNMYSSVDYSVTPRPIYRADGLKLPDVYSYPQNLGKSLQEKLGEFPLFNFWGPKAGIESSRWIAQASLEVAEKFKPTLLLSYLPHLDYCLQREGPQGKSIPQELANLDGVCRDLVSGLKSRGYQILVLSEYGIQKVRKSIRINEFLRMEGWLEVRDELNEDHFDAGASRAFAVADHQIAHVYVKDQDEILKVRSALERLEGVDQILDRREQKKWGIQHHRSGDLIVLAQMDRWFSYRYWLQEERAPDFAGTVDIHRKPGYDPAELFLNPDLKFPFLRVARRLLAKKLGFRYLMDVISLNEDLVQGSHGRSDVLPEFWPVLFSEREELFQSDLPSIERVGVEKRKEISALQIKELILNHIFDGE